MPHKKRANKHQSQVKKILADGELSLLDKNNRRTKSYERVPRNENDPADRKRAEQLMQGESDDDTIAAIRSNLKKKKKKKTKENRLELQNHINKELQQQQSTLIPRKSRKNKYYLLNHPELKDLVVNTKKRKYQSDEQVESPKKQKKTPPPPEPISTPVKPSACDKLLVHMVTSRFRYLNEKLYTSTSTDAQKLFAQDPQAFNAYHEGYSASMTRWPNQPLDEIIAYIRKRSPNLVIADMGCGEAHLARSLLSTHRHVYSFDFVALNEHVQVCDIAHTPLNDNAVDIVVFCLSLMGTNLSDFIFEAHRILRLRGTMKIVEIASRFENMPQKFVRKIESIGFQCSRTNSTSEDSNIVEEKLSIGKKKTKKNNRTPSKYFYTFDFVKTSERIKSRPILTLAPCLHKKR